MCRRNSGQKLITHGREGMQNILAQKLVGVTELREPNKVIEKAGNEPVAIMKRNEVVGYFVPASAVENVSFRYATDEEFAAITEVHDEITAEGIAYLKDK